MPGRAPRRPPDSGMGPPGEPPGGPGTWLPGGIICMGLNLGPGLMKDGGGPGGTPGGKEGGGRPMGGPPGGPGGKEGCCWREPTPPMDCTCTGCTGVATGAVPAVSSTVANGSERPFCLNSSGVSWLF